MILKFSKIILALAVVVAMKTTVFAQKPNVAKQFKYAEKQTRYMLTLITADTNKQLVSPRTFEDGKLKLVSAKDWTSGFFPGVLWYLYDYTGNKKWMEQARLFTANIAPEQYTTTTHDLGFMIYCSFGNGYRLTKDDGYKKVIIQAAKSLSKRFNAKTGVIQSWEKNEKWTYPVIIDNMMNLELLFEATKLTGDSSFYKIAVSHANKTIVNHYRADYSSYHVVDYDPETGKVVQKNTAQGYSDASAWARGQAWGLYGFTLCYRETGDKKYLAQAQHIADFILNNPALPKDLIPDWDYNDPAIPNAPRDASAAAIMASALYELAAYSSNNDYRAKADKILTNLTAHYTAPVNSNGGFLLLHSTGHKPAKSEIDVPLIYADYYYLEALLRSRTVKN